MADFKTPTETELVDIIKTNCEVPGNTNIDQETFDKFLDNTTDINTDGPTWANWDNLLDYIKLNLGTSVNNIEFTDQEIIDIITNHVLPVFSRYDPYIRYYMMFEHFNVISRSPLLVYQIKNFPYKILRVNRLIRKPTVLDMTQYYNLQQTSGDLTDMLIAQNSFSMSKDFISKDTWVFRAPDKIHFVRGSNNYGSVLDFIVELECVHKDPSTVTPDLYQYLEELALAHVFIYIGRIRSKFQTFNTPQSQVDVNAQEILQEGLQLKEKVLQELDDLPPDTYIYFLN